LLGENFEGDEFIDWLAEELVNRGAILDVSSEPPVSVQQVGEVDLQGLKQQLDAAISLIQANKPTFLNYLREIDDGVVSLKQKIGDQLKQISHGAGILQQRNDAIARLANRLVSNQQKFDEHVLNAQQTRQTIDDKVKYFQKQATQAIQNNAKGGGVQPFYKSVKDTLAKISKSNKVDDIGLKISKNDLNMLKKSPAFKHAFPPTNSITAKTGNKIGFSAYGKGGKAYALGKKPTFVGKVRTKVGKVVSGVKKKISNSAIGKTYRGIKSVVQKTYRAVKAVVKTVAAVAVGVYAATKFAVKTFVKASKIVGKAGILAAKFGLAVGKSIYNAGKRVVKSGIELARKLKGKAKVFAIILAPLAVFHSTWAPAQFVAKLGWRAIKFIGRKLWKGIKFLFFKTASLFAGLFRMVGKFVNKVSNWVSRIGRGIVDKAYRFIVKPIATMMVTVFGFVAQVVMAPIQFMKSVIPAIFDRVREAMHNIKEGIMNAYRATLSFVKRILTNPITLVLLVGGMFFIFGKWLYEKLTGQVVSVKEVIFGTISTIAKTIWGFLKMAWGIASFVGKILFNVVEWLTRPDGWVVKAIKWVVGAFLWIKGLIKSWMKESGKSNIDIFCMFLAGDMIGIALHAIAGLVVKLWKWLKNTKVFKLVFGLIKFIAGMQLMIYSIQLRLVQSIGGAIWKIIKGDWGDVPEAFAKPWKEWWRGVSSLFGNVASDISYASADRDYMKENPVETNDKTATNAKVAIRSLHMKGRPEQNLKTFSIV